MKRVLALILALVMVFSLVACGGEKADDTPAADAPAADKPAADAPAADEPAADEPAADEPAAEGTVGWYSDPVDHYARDAYQIVYMMMSMSAMNANFSKGFEVWSGRLNYEYQDFSANNENDTFITTLETFAIQGVDGFIIDFSDDVRSRLLDLLPELDVEWMSGMVSAFDDDGKLAHPSLGFDMYQFGVEMYNYLTDLAPKKWADFDITKTGILYVDFSGVYEITVREDGFRESLEAEYPELLETNYFVADTIAQGGMSAELAYNEASAIVSAHPEFERWIVAGGIDDFGQGAARVFETAGKTDNALVTSIGGETLIAEWDAGYTGCWVSAYFTAQMIYCEGIICGLIAMLDGRATPETLWADFIPEGEKYAQIDIPSVFIEQDNYTEYCEWVDSYTGYDWSPYEYQGTDFSYTLEYR